MGSEMCIRDSIDCASVVWDGCSDVFKKRLNSLHRRGVILIFVADTSLIADQKLKEMRIMSLQNQLEYNKGLFMYRVLSNEAPEYISNLYTHSLTLFQSRNYYFSLPRPRIDIFKTSISFSGAYLWNNLPLTTRYCHSAPSSVNFVHTLKYLHRMDCDIILLGREREGQTEVFE